MRALSLLSPYDWRLLQFAMLGLVVSSTCNLLVPRTMGTIIDLSIHSTSTRANLVMLVKKIGPLVGCGALGSFLRVYSLKTAARRIENTLRLRLYRAILCEDLFQNPVMTPGEYYARISTSVPMVAQGLTETIARLFRGLNSTCGGIFLLFWVAPQLAVLSVCLVPCVALTAFAYTAYARRRSKELQTLTANVLNWAQERVSNIEVVQVFSRQEEELMTFSNQLHALDACARVTHQAEALCMGSIFAAVTLTFAVILFVGGSFVRNGTLSYGSLVTFAFYSGMVGLGLSLLTKALSDIGKTSAAASQCFDILDMPLTLPDDTELSSVLLPSSKGHIIFKNVSFAYKARPETPVLQDISFELRPGEVRYVVENMLCGLQRVAVAGCSGAGKTTLLRLLVKFLRPTAGSILLDGDLLRVIDTGYLRRNIMGVVSQEPTLFTLTVADNIRYGKPDATDEDVEQAARQANAHDFIMQLPRQYKTYVGERGAELSAGQKQRLTIARAILKNPACLLLDEATCSLDCASEAAVQQALERASSGRTVLVIAHRISTLRWAQRILFLCNGSIQATGTYEELIQRCPEFSRLVDSFPTSPVSSLALKKN